MQNLRNSKNYISHCLDGVSPSVSTLDVKYLHSTAPSSEYQALRHSAAWSSRLVMSGGKEGHRVSAADSAMQIDAVMKWRFRSLRPGPRLNVIRIWLIDCMHRLIVQQIDYILVPASNLTPKLCDYLHLASCRGTECPWRLLCCCNGLCLEDILVVWNISINSQSRVFSIRPTKGRLYSRSRAGGRLTCCLLHFAAFN